MPRGQSSSAKKAVLSAQGGWPLRYNHSRGAQSPRVGGQGANGDTNLLPSQNRLLSC